MQLLFNHDDLYNFYKDKEKIKIFFSGKLVCQINDNDIVEKRRAVIQFVNMEVSVNKLSEIFSVNRSTIYSWYDTYDKEGISGLDKIHRGPERVSEEVEAYILAKFKDLNFSRNYKTIICTKIKEHYNVNLHWRTIATVLKRNNVDVSCKKNNKRIAPKTIDETKTSTLHSFSEYAGLLLLYPFLGKLNLPKLFSRGLKDLKNMHYDAKNYIYGLLLLLISNLIEVEENIKLYDDKNFTQVVGKNGIPCLRSFRENLPKIISNIDISDIQMGIAKNYFTTHKECSAIFIDGHFLPYNGKFNIFRGYNPIRRLAMKGRTGYFLNSEEGRPFFYILSDGYKDFREYLQEIAVNLKTITGGRNKNELLFVFDRGGYGKEFLSDLSPEVNFVCWRTGKENPPIKPDWKNILLTHKSNTFGEDKKIEIHACETIEKPGNKKPVRWIYIRKNTKISLAFSNDPDRTLEELVSLLTRRWGAQENIFKGLKKQGVDRIGSYLNNEYPDNWLLEETEERLVANPQNVILQEHINNLNQQKKKTLVQLGKNSVNLGIKNSKAQENIILIREVTRLEEKVEEFKKCISKMPTKIPVTELIKSNDIIRLNTNKKKFLDVMRILSYNVQQDVVDLIRPIYKNERDVNMLARQIFRKSGKIEITEKYISVCFNKFHSKKKNLTLEYLCNYCNEQKINHPISGKSLLFSCI